MKDDVQLPEPVKVSVLLPVYNAAEYVAEAIESILSQTFEAFELLIIDDGSTDGSADIVARYAQEDHRIRYISRENRGLVRTLNELAEMARGEYLARMDADDVSLPDRFQLQVSRLDADSSLSVLGTYWICTDEAGYPIFVPQPPLDHADIDELNLCGVAALSHPTVMMRLDHFRAVGGYDSRFETAEDVDLWLRLAEYGRLANIDAILLRYRMLETSISGIKRDQQQETLKQVCITARERRGLPPRDIKRDDWRPGTDARSRAQFAISWGWRAWKSGNQKTARRYFLKALKLSPFQLRSWKAIMFGFLRPR